MDRSNGYERQAEMFMRSRNANIGTDVVRDWARLFPRDAAILELGCGHGAISQVLADHGLTLYAVDASPTLLNVFRTRFPAAQTECAGAENSDYFNRTFDGALAWGLIFLLLENAQRAVLTKVAHALEPGGRFLFTAPREAAVWTDALTEQESRSLGAERYRSILGELGFDIEPGCTDAGGSYYYFAIKKK